MEYREAVQEAKKLGINTHGKKKDELERLISESVKEPALKVTDEQKQQAKEARTERRSRRGGALLGKGEMKLNREEFQRKGYHRRWFKDEGGRLDAAYAADYDYVLDKEGKKRTIRSGTNRDGSLRTLYLMEKREDWYKEDQLKKRESDLQKEQLLRDGKVTGSEFAGAAKDLDMYDGKININNSVIKQ